MSNPFDDDNPFGVDTQATVHSKKRTAKATDLISPAAQNSAQRTVKWIWTTLVLSILGGLFVLASYFIASNIPAFRGQSPFKTFPVIIACVTLGTLAAYAILVFGLNRLREETELLGRYPNDRQFTKWLEANSIAWIIFVCIGLFNIAIQGLMFIITFWWA